MVCRVDVDVEMMRAEDSNSQPSDLESDALPLRHTPAGHANGFVAIIAAFMQYIAI